MNLIRWNPWREMDTLPNRINRLFEGTLFPTTWLNTESGLRDWRPVVDIYEEEDKTVIKAEIPGVDKDKINVDVKDGILTLTGERSYENEAKEDSYYRKERFYGKFHRAFTLPADYDSEKVKADFKDGVLKIDIPKPEEKKPKNRTIH